MCQICHLLVYLQLTELFDTHRKRNSDSDSHDRRHQRPSKTGKFRPEVTISQRRIFSMLRTCQARLSSLLTCSDELQAATVCILIMTNIQIRACKCPGVRSLRAASVLLSGLDREVLLRPLSLHHSDHNHHQRLRTVGLQQLHLHSRSGQS
jgi:hypothetical protein